jgi:hypothetical protein
VLTPGADVVTNMQVDRKGDVCDCVVARYDRRSARHEVVWTDGGSQRVSGRAWVDFAEDMVYTEVAQAKKGD